MVNRAAVAVLVSVTALSPVVASAAFADEFGSHAPGQHVYDRANVLRPEQVQMLERRAATLDALGAPTIVYVRVEAATQAQVQQEARELMDEWDVESAHGAHDGFVMLFDLTPGNTQHGQVGMFAGAEHATAELDGDELDRIATDVMRPSLASGDLAGGIDAGLEATAKDLGGPASAGGTSIRPVTTTTATGALPPSITALASSLPGELGVPLAGLLGVILLPLILPIFIVSMVIIFIRSSVRRALRGRGWTSSGYPGYSGWTDSGSSWSGGGDSGGASSGGDSGGTSF
jgi:uncharacterized membrane protein YgcG